MEGQHHKHFLQWGSQAYHAGHIRFEIGDMRTLVKIDFKETREGGECQIDNIQIFDDTGVTQEQYDIDCENLFMKPFMNKVLKIVGNAVVNLKNQNPIQAEKEFSEMSSVIRDLIDLSEDYEAECDEMAKNIDGGAHRAP